MSALPLNAIQIAAHTVAEHADREALEAVATTPSIGAQPPMSANARQAGLEAFRAVLRRHHPGCDVVFDLAGAKGDRRSKRRAQNEV
jgi:hypothetical protein